MAVSFTELRGLMQKIDALATRLDTPQATTNPAPMVGQLVDGALSVVHARLAQFEQQFAQHEQRMANLAVEVRAAIPQMPDFGPLVAALEAVTARMGEGSDRIPADPPGLAALIQSNAEMTAAFRAMCTQMDKPIVREGVADLPSGGQVKMRITETRAR